MPRLSILSVLFACFVTVSQAQDTTLVQDRMCNILCVAPFQFSENGLGFGACYERIIDRRGRLSIELPAFVTFSVANTNRIYDYNTGNYSTGKPNALFYALPGIKYYPAGSRGKLKYAVGLAVAGGSGQESVGYINLYGLNTTEKVVPHLLLGGVLQNSLNVQAGKRLYAGLEMGAGTTFVNKVDHKEQGSLFLIQGCFKIGCRF